MADQEVIDLTDSFALADHTELANVVIELDDTLNETDGTYAPVNNVGRPSQNRKKSKTSKKKVEQPHKAHNVAKVELVRERSPLRSQVGDCPICLESIGSNPLASTKCGHVFCHHCLIQALHLEKKCPTCRRSLYGKSSFHPLFLNKG